MPAGPDPPRASFGLSDSRVRNLGREVEQQADDLGAGDPVDHGVMDLRVDRHVARRKPRDDVHLPERPGTVEPARVQPGDLRRQLAIVAGSREREIPHVEFEIELAIFHPVGKVQPERNLLQAPSKHRQHVHAIAEQPDHHVAGQFAVRGSARVVNPHAPDVPRLAPVFDRQELHVKAGELSHPRSLCLSLLRGVWPTGRRFCAPGRACLVSGHCRGIVATGTPAGGARPDGRYGAPRRPRSSGRFSWKALTPTRCRSARGCTAGFVRLTSGGTSRPNGARATGRWGKGPRSHGLV